MTHASRRMKIRTKRPSRKAGSPGAAGSGNRTLRRVLVGLLAVVPLVQCTFAQSPEQVFQTANQLYQQGRYAEARDTYISIVRNGFVSGELYYNLGNAQYKTGDVGRAILSYERALRYMPADEDLRHNLQLANLLITDKIEAAPRLFIWDGWDTVKAAFSVDGLTWITYVLFLLLCGAVGVLAGAKAYRRKKAGLLAGVFAAVLLAVSLLILGGKIGDVNRTDLAIVVADITTVKNSPDAKSTDAFVLHSGVKVTIMDAVSGWLKVRLADGKVGWMERGAAEVI